MPRVGVAIGDEILDVPACHAAELFVFAGHDAESGATACNSSSLNDLMSLGSDVRKALRNALTELLSIRANVNAQQTARHALVSQKDAEMFLPAVIGDYTDFYASIHHATNVGSLFRPDNPLLPNYKWVPIGYHGRASSIVVSGTTIKRPHGQLKSPNQDIPTVGPTQLLDYELELGALVGTGNTLGESVPISDAESHIWGYCLLNDWSARDIQSWEYQPLGPFLAKNFASTVGAWVVTPEALEPFRAPLTARAPSDPEPLPYLTDAADRARGGLNLTVEVWISTARMRAEGHPEVCISSGNCLDLYWSFAQMLTHHTSGGCNLRTGDLLGSGTISGPKPESRGCLLELTRRGSEPLALPNGEIRRFLETDDEIIITAFAEGSDGVRIGFGRCVGRIAG